MGAMLADTLAVSETDMILPVVPMFHANAWGLAQAGVMAGSTFVMPGPDLSPKAIAGPDGVRAGDARRRRADDLDGRPGRARGRELSSLKRILCGGSAVPKSLSEAYREKIGLRSRRAGG